MRRSLQERWEAVVARGGPEVAEVHRTIAAATARAGYLSAQQVMTIIETALNRLEQSNDNGPED